MTSQQVLTETHYNQYWYKHNEYCYHITISDIMLKNDKEAI